VSSSAQAVATVGGAPSSFAPLERLLAALGAPIGRRALFELVQAVGLPPPAGERPWTYDSLGVAIADLERRGRVLRQSQGLQLEARLRFEAFRAAALGPELRAWAPALLERLAGPRSLSGLHGGTPGNLYWQAGPATPEGTVATLRVLFCGGLPRRDVAPLLESLRFHLHALTWVAAFAQPFDAALLARIDDPVLRGFAVERLLAVALHRPQPWAAEVVRWALDHLAEPRLGEMLRRRTAEHLLWRREFARAEEVLAATDPGDGFTLALRAAGQAMQGDASAALAAYAAADAALRKAGQPNRGTLPLPIAWQRWWALLQDDATTAAEAALKYCRAEARKGGVERHVWEDLADAAACRTGERPVPEHPRHLDGHDALLALLAAEACSIEGRAIDKAGIATLRRDREHYAAAGYAWAAAELDRLLGALDGSGGSRRDWQRTLKALRALGAAHGDAGNDAAAVAEQRLGWVVQADDYELRIEPCLQKRGPRGWGRNRITSLAGVMRSERLDPRDAAVCRAAVHHGGKSWSLDGERALQALVGHPRVYLAPDLDTAVELVAAAPTLEVRRTRGGVRVGLAPEVREALQGWLPASSASQPDPVVLLRDSPTRARVIRLGAAQRRLAQLVGKGLDVPDEGLGELDQVLQELTGPFEIHSELDSTAQEVEPERRLRAELSPSGSGLRLRLALRPLGAEGPRVLPGRGGAQVLAAIGGVRQRAVRDLRAERAAAAALLESLPGLEANDEFEWTVDDPQECLELVASLQARPDEVLTEWPAGKALRVTAPRQVADLRVGVPDGGRDWFRASGGLALDDGAVLPLQRLIDLAREHRGRFLPLGDGGFVALGEELRRRVDELSRLGERDADGVRFPALAALSVGEVLEGATLPADGQDGWRALHERFEAAQSLEPAVPATLQAELRPYQLEGFRWLARLAAFGAGACLADDMGLGKTLQAIALLLHRAPGGAALVVAPTSVVPNWLEELRRFAPSLSVQEYRGAGRADLVPGAAAFDVLVGSYTLVQQDVEALGARPWHTLVLDEAQQVKNAATKRAQAVLALQADCRVATTGTPVENRLDELWMLFRFLNPGLLGSRERFVERFATPIERHGDAAARAQLRRLVRPFVLRRLKGEVLPDLPPRTEITLTVRPEPTEAAFHEALRRSAVEQLAREDLPPAQRRFRALAELMRLRRACCDPTLVAPGAALAGAKLEAFGELAGELAAGRHKALVFSQFTDFLDRLGARLDALGLRHQRLDGSTPAAERTRRIEAFQRGDGDFFLISLKAGGFGLNLTAADYVILADPWWNPAAEDQAAARAWRLGQARPVTVYRLVLEGSIEQQILALHRDKRALAEGLFGGEEFGSALSTEQMLELLRGAAEAPAGR
jgi:superfamily II DNA or RNA helicase